MIRVLVADDHTVVREGLKRIISEVPDLQVTAEARTGSEVLEQLRNQQCDVLLLDLSMPEVGGLDVLHQLQTQKSDLPVLILSIHPATLYAMRVLKAGAAGYLTKESAPDELIAAIRTVAGGHKYITPEVAEQLAAYLQTGEPQTLHERLSDREYQILCLIGSGKTLTEIARELRLSASTVSTYRSRILRKMNLKNNAELTRYALKEGLAG